MKKSHTREKDQIVNELPKDSGLQAELLKILLKMKILQEAASKWL